eukprot:CAMPEP_0117447522 /NCGR_PEP_ID=MMETSP0759-20121206/6921_1 /TAXON_ID=63605 /ORGANISM="Percolomonas cosmopolitus, Strain WS" /LENGTH=113 /DNA_ID=CAMNT_0005239865 /DNA_START=66 /DNA_END=407 /DNA_ORIENTATION=-
MVKYEQIQRGTGLSVGLNRGHQRTALRPVKPAAKKSARASFRRKLVAETVGYQPYELRVMDMNEITEKKALRFAKRRLGNIRRAKKKVKQMAEVKRLLKKQAPKEAPKTEQKA